MAVDRRDLYAALHTEAGLNALINLQVEGEEYLTVAREVQRHPVRGDIIHLDFIRISLDENIEAEVPVEFTGIPVGVREAKGIVETVHASVVVSCLPTAIPSHITIDISELRIDDFGPGVRPARDPGVAYVTDPTSCWSCASSRRPPRWKSVPGAAAEGEEAAAAEGEGED